MSSLAQEESRSISENVTWGHRKRMADGKVAVAYSHFLGYDRGDDGNLVVNPEEAETIKFIYAQFLLGFSYKAIAGKLMEKGIKSPGGKDKWSQRTVKSILSNEKYKGDALLQKTYTQDFLTKKQVVNKGEIPQYYVEDNHEAIIEPAVFDRVQDMIRQRAERKGYSGMTIFSSKLKCGECGGWYGSKVWHSNDKYRKVVWQCDAKFRQKKYCKTPNLTEEDIKEAFIRVMNQLIIDKEEILAQLRAVQAEFSGTEELEKEQRRLAEQMNIDAEAVQELIAENARTAQDQEAYRLRYETLVSRFEEAKAKHEQVTAEITMRGIRQREFNRFITELENLPEVFAEFDETLWGSLVDYVTVYDKDNLVFTLAGGTEIKA